MKRKKRFLLCCLLFVFCTLTALPASANSYDANDVNGKNIVYAPLVKKNFQEYTRIHFPLLDKKGKIITYKLVKNSLTYDKKHLTVTFEGLSFIDIIPKKTGISNVSFKIKANGKTKKYSFLVYSFKLDKPPFTSFKFGSKRLDIAKYMDHKGNYYKTYPMEMYSYCLTLGTKKILFKGIDTGKISIKLRNGWSIKSTVMHYRSGETKKVSLSKKIKFTQSDTNADTLEITFVNKQGCEVIFKVSGYANN